MNECSGERTAIVKCHSSRRLTILPTHNIGIISIRVINIFTIISIIAIDTAAIITINQQQQRRRRCLCSSTFYWYVYNCTITY